jgi:hypothetical protein
MTKLKTRERNGMATLNGTFKDSYMIGTDLMVYHEVDDDDVDDDFNDRPCHVPGG